MLGSIETGIGALQNPISLMVLKREGENPCKGLSHKVCLIILRRIPGEREILKHLGLLEKWLGVFIHFSFLHFLPSFFSSFLPFLLFSSLLLPLSHLPPFHPSLLLSVSLG